MIPLSGKAKKIKEEILGSPPNEHLAYSRDPRIRDSDKRRVLTALLVNDMMNANQNMPQNDQGM